MNRKMTDLIVVGFALFSMFLGAGNLIFPPYLGLHAGETWLPALIGFLLTGVGLPLMTVYATLRSGGTIMTLARYVGRPFGRLLGLIVVLSIGPMFAIPRTAATTYEVGVATIVPSVPIEVSSVVFFVIVWALTINRSKVVDRLGKYLTPFLLLTLFAIVVAAVINPIGTPGAAAEPAYNFAGGFTEGYQTMDALAASMFAGVALSNIVARGYNNREEQLSMSIRCGVIAAVLLGLVYCGLTYGGAGATGAFPADIDRSALLIGMTSGLLGSIGAYCLSVAVILACLTTAIGLTVTTGEYFNELSGGKLSYKLVVTLTVIAALLISVLGVTTIINLAVPFLNMVLSSAHGSRHLQLPRPFHSKQKRLHRRAHRCLPHQLHRRPFRRRQPWHLRRLDRQPARIQSQPATGKLRPLLGHPSRRARHHLLLHSS